MEGLVPLLIVGALVVLGVVVAVLVVGAVAALLFRGRGVDPVAARAEALASLGYDGRQDGTWAYPIQGTTMVFRNRPEGLEWKLQLPRYNTMTMELAERASGRQLENAFSSGVRAIDERFVVGSPQPDRIVTLLKQPKLQKALLKMHDVSIRLSADELIIVDPGKAGVDGTPDADPIESELQVHATVINVVNMLFGTMYGEGGTVLDMYR